MLINFYLVDKKAKYLILYITKRVQFVLLKTFSLFPLKASKPMEYFFQLRKNLHVDAISNFFEFLVSAENLTFRKK